MGNVSSCFLATKGATTGAATLTSTKTIKTVAKQLEMWELLKQRGDKANLESFQCEFLCCGPPVASRILNLRRTIVLGTLGW